MWTRGTSGTMDGLSGRSRGWAPSLISRSSSQGSDAALLPPGAPCAAATLPLSGSQFLHLQGGRAAGSGCLVCRCLGSSLWCPPPILPSVPCYKHISSSCHKNSHLGLTHVLRLPVQMTLERAGTQMAPPELLGGAWNGRPSPGLSLGILTWSFRSSCRNCRQ